MAQTSANVRAGVAGGVSHAPTGTTLPTSATASLNAAFKELGLLSEEGIIESEGRSVNQVKAWQNGSNVRAIQTEHSLTYKFTCIETNVEVAKLIHGSANVTGTTDLTIQVKADALARECFAFDVLDGSNTIRIVVPAGQVIERGDTAYAGGDAISYPVTIECYPDGSGVKAYKYTDDGVA